MNESETKRDYAWNSIPDFLKAKMDKATFDLAWGLAWIECKNLYGRENKND